VSGSLPLDRDSVSPIIRAMTDYRIAALYRFTDLPDYATLKAPLLERLRSLDIRGTILLAHEGINGTVAGKRPAIDALIDWLRCGPVWNSRLRELDVKFSNAATLPFARCKVKLKREIVTMGVQGIDPVGAGGTYIEPRDWNALISSPDVVTVDTRNDYEVAIGRFRGARNPKTTTFREFPDYVNSNLDPARHKRVAMYCTGGIRCEKSTAYLKSLGFDEVYHLRGGILRYLEEIPQENSLWEGECFVFDERVTVDHHLQPGRYTQCHACRMPLSADDLADSRYAPGESCPHCCSAKTDAQRARYRERQKQIRLAEQRGETHTGDAAGTIAARRRAAKLASRATQRVREDKG
jgi:UPF0176 protein